MELVNTKLNRKKKYDSDKIIGIIVNSKKLESSLEHSTY